MTDLGYVMRSIGQNPSDKEVEELFKQHKLDETNIDYDGAVKCGNAFAEKMGSVDHKKMLLDVSPAPLSSPRPAACDSTPARFNPAPSALTRPLPSRCCRPSRSTIRRTRRPVPRLAS